MHIVRVTYTVRDEYAKKNQENIGNVMRDLRTIGNPGIRYCTYLGENGKTFTHLAMFSDKELQKILFDLPSFQKFQVELKESKLEAPVSQEHLQLVGSSYEIFN